MIDAYIVDNDCIYGNILDHHLTLKIIMAYKYMKHLHPRTSTMKPSPSKKLKRLEKSKTLNPSPEKIKHPLFRLRSDFFDPNDLLQVRYEMVRLVLLEHQTLAQAARHFGVSRPTCFRMTRAFKNAGLEGLKPAPRGPRGPRKITPEIVSFVVNYRARHGRVGARRLVPIIEKKFNVQVHPRGLEKALARTQKKLQTTPHDAQRRL